MEWALTAIALLAVPYAASAQGTAPVPPKAEVPIALLVDVTSNQVLYAREAERRFVPASITKVMTLYHAFELIDEGSLTPSQRFQMREETWAEWHRQGSTMFIPNGAKVAVSDLLMGIANVSANDGAIALAEGQAGTVNAWLDAMNSRARALGMTNSHFGTPNGWPDEGRTFTTANDLVRLAKALTERHPDKVKRYIGQPGFRFNDIAQSNRDPMIGRVKGADGIKTGFTSEAGLGYLGTAKRNGQRLVVVIAGANKESTRGEAARNLIEWGFAQFDRNKVVESGQLVGKARVQNGAASWVDLQTSGPVYVNLPRVEGSAVTMSIAYDGPLHAPITAGKRVATLLVTVPGLEPARIPLVASQDVAKAGFFTRIWNGFMGWFV
ncbi:D-alanyl-D-alanine carboxypeptidase [Erythrobacter sp. SCSIO 43205]|nr:D-alanyl-D-alanine carboxypeptidase [Erythrobacter sp. SCSIO 43205]